MDKLKSRKAEVGEQLDRSRVATRFEPTPPLAGASRRAGPIGEPLLEGGQARASRGRRGRPSTPPAGPRRRRPPSPRKPSYTNRLLKAKQQVWEEREKEKEKDKREPESHRTQRCRDSRTVQG